MQLSEAHLYVLGLVVTAIVFGVNMYMQKRGRKVHRAILTAIVFAISVVLAYIWNSPEFPPLPANGGDPAAYASALAAFAGQLIASATAILGAATVIYNTILQKVFDRLSEKAVMRA